MRTEIERKFFVRTMPHTGDLRPRRYERYILSNEGGKEVRISKIDDVCFFEEKREVSSLERVSSKVEISSAKFDALKRTAEGGLIRDRYTFVGDPKIDLQVYHGRFEGLVRAEVEFSSREEAERFKPLPWMGREMTGMPIARDATLIGLSDEEFQRSLRGS